jgi:hypothetical protein
LGQSWHGASTRLARCASDGTSLLSLATTGDAARGFNGARMV